MAPDLPHNLTYPMDDITGAQTDQGNFELTHHDGTPYILLGLVIPHVVCTIFVLLRVLSRTVHLGRWYMDDTLMILAWLFSTGVCLVYGLAIRMHQVGGSENPLIGYLLRTYLGLVFYQLSLCFSKLSIATLYLRMLSSKPAMRWLSWATIILVIGFGIPLLLMSLFQCYPTTGYVLGRPMSCLGFTELLVFSACVHTATDAWLIILIVPTISRLELPRRQKVALSIILSLGIFVIAASMIRLQLSLQKDFTPTIGAQGANTTAFFVMTILECDTAIICASAPMIRPFLSKVKGPFKRENPRLHRGPTSFNLTTVVSYHGYPWDRHQRFPEPPLPSFPRLSFQPSRESIASSGNIRVVISRPQFPALSPSPSANNRTYISTSLKALVGARTPKGRGMTGPDTTPILAYNAGKIRSKSAPGRFDSHGDPYPGSGEPKKSKFKGSAINVIDTNKEWSSSQESFMSPKDPANSRTLSRYAGQRDSTWHGEGRVSLENHASQSVKDSGEDDRHS